MASRGLIAGAAVAALALAASGLVVGLATDRAGAVAPIEIAAQDLENGAEIYAAQCASCHGAELEGAPDWRTPGPGGLYPAPPHDATGHTWHHDDTVLYDYVALGGTGTMAKAGVDYESGMLAYADVLSDAEIRDVLAFIKSTWPDRERLAQQERTAAARP